MNTLYFRFLLLWLMGVSACTVQHTVSFHQNTSLQLINVFEVPYKYTFAGTTVGGLSGIDYDAKQNRYFLISDDRSAINTARFYTAHISLSKTGIDSVLFQGMYYLHNSDHRIFAPRSVEPQKSPDPEAIRLDVKRNSLVWSSEGERSFKPGDTVLQHPYIFTMNLGGDFLNRYETPEKFFVRKEERGVRHNGSWEGLSFSDNYKHLWVVTEEPLFEDGPRAGTGDSSAWVRFSCFHTTTRKEYRQVAYRIDPVAYPPVPSGGFKVSGVVEILWTKGEKFLVMERSFSEGGKGCVIKIYLADFNKATDVREVSSLQNASFTAVEKKLLFTSASLPFTVYNVEGMTFGPKLPDGRRSLILVADDNFSEKDKTQFLLLAVNE